MRARLSMLFVGLGLAGCWYDIADLSSGGASSSAVTPVATSTGDASAKSASSSAASTSDATGSGGQGSGGAASSASGASTGAIIDGPFDHCATNGYAGACVGTELLVYFDEYDACSPEHTDKCYLNRCGSNGTGVCQFEGMCADYQCDWAVSGAAVIDCADTVDAAGSCIDGVAFRRVDSANCDFKDCVALGAECKQPGEVPAADCYAARP